jgi:hypothetical protein
VSVPIAAAIVIRPVALLPAVALVAVATVLVERWTWRRLAILLGPVAVAAGGVAGWNAWVGLVFDDPRYAAAGSSVDALQTSLAAVPAHLQAAVAALSWGEVSAPWPAQVLSGLVAVASVVVVWRSRSNRLRLSLAVLLAVLVLGPVAFEVAVHDRIGFIWQGRYSISTLVGLGALAAAAAAHSPCPAPSPSRLGAALPATALVASGLAEVIAFWTVLRRYCVGAEGSWWFAGHRGWSPALDPRLLLGAHVGIVCAALTWICIPSSVGRRRHPEPTK